MLAQRDGLLGWATGRLIYHDEIAPGCIRRILTSGPARRQAIFALIAAEIAAQRHNEITGADPDEGCARRRAEIIRDGSARDVLTELLGRDPPDGLSGGLERVGLTALPAPGLYRQLIDIYLTPARRPAAEALRHVGKITMTMIRSLDVLPACLLHANVLKRLETMSDAYDSVKALEFVQAVNSRATDEVILGAVSRLSQETPLDAFFSRYIRRADKPLGGPLAPDHEVRPINSVRDLISAGRFFRNCLTSDRKIVSALQGKAAYATFGDAVLEFASLNNGQWLFVAAHVRGNELVPLEIVDAARSKCSAAGVLMLPEESRGTGEFGRLLDPFDPLVLRLAA